MNRKPCAVKACPRDTEEEGGNLCPGHRVLWDRDAAAGKSNRFGWWCADRSRELEADPRQVVRK